MTSPMSSSPHEGFDVPDIPWKEVFQGAFVIFAIVASAWAAFAVIAAIISTSISVLGINIGILKTLGIMVVSGGALVWLDDRRWQ